MNVRSTARTVKAFGLVHQQRLLLAIVLLLGLAVGTTACAPRQEPPQQDTGARISEKAMFPNWTVREMAERSDAVVIGTLEASLGSKGIPGKYMDSASYVRLFTDYKFKVEQVLYVRDRSVPQYLALLTRTGIVLTAPGRHVEEAEGFPVFQTGERVLLFLRGSSEEEVRLEPGHFVPAGFTVDEYYWPLVSGLYGKLVPQGGDWRDSRTGKPVTASELRQAVEAVEGAAR